MIPSGLFTQIMMTVLALSIVFFYVRPTFSQIGAIQDDIAVYQEERSKVSEVNAQLNRLVDRYNQVSAADRVALTEYMPDEVDVVEVPRNILAITQQAGVLLRSVAYQETRDDIFEMQSDERSRALPHAFTVSVEGTYEQVKEFIGLLEQNEYPLEIHSLSINPLGGGFVTSDMELVTYSHIIPSEDE